MRTSLFLFAIFFFLAPARSGFLEDKCYKLKGRCVESCHINEELVGLCRKSLKCCVTLQACWKSWSPVRRQPPEEGTVFQGCFQSENKHRADPKLGRVC
ncbi:beta-defensin 106A-like [Eubalaena glacialis]|uniref:beta-defensin 106A-like n=1 Tax=Eubalaena glacialis TaxID=27606 RepID=UPI002A5A3219|nr:beta-defensin 106A-like [Eubalaena glacialis]